MSGITRRDMITLGVGAVLPKPSASRTAETHVAKTMGARSSSAPPCAGPSSHRGSRAGCDRCEGRDSGDGGTTGWNTDNISLSTIDGRSRSSRNVAGAASSATGCSFICLPRSLSLLLFSGGLLGRVGDRSRVRAVALQRGSIATGTGCRSHQHAARTSGPVRRRVSVEALCLIAVGVGSGASDGSARGGAAPSSFAAPAASMAGAGSGCAGREMSVLIRSGFCCSVRNPHPADRGTCAGDFRCGCEASVQNNQQ